MKKILSAVVVLCCFLVMACEKPETITETVTVTDTLTITRTVNLDSGLIAYYPFNGNANDESGNNKNGTLVNGTSFSTDAKNVANKSANFDGVDDYIRIADQTNYFAPSKLSVSFLVNLRNVSARSSIITKSAFTTASAVCWGGSITNQVGFTVPDPTASCTDLWYDNPGADLHSQGNLQNNTWYHITLIFNQGVEMIYVNGALNSARVSNYSYLKQCAGADLKIGGWWQNDIVSIHGKLDEVRLYNRILSEQEIAKLATQMN